MKVMCFYSIHNHGLQENKTECYGNIWCERIGTQQPGGIGEGQYLLTGHARLQCNVNDGTFKNLP